MVDIRPLPADLQKVAIEELNEVPERVASDIEALKTWIQQQPYLRARTNDQFLLAFLRGCKFSLEKAKSKIDRYYMLRSKFPEIFTCRDVDEPKIRELIRYGIGLYLPMPYKGNGPRIAYVRNGIVPADKYSFLDVLRIGQAVNEILLMEDDYAVVNGLIHIMDMENLTAQHLLQISPSLMKKMTIYSEEALPLRPKASHFINTPSFFESVFNVFQHMMSAKMKSRLFVHGTKLDKLFEQIDRKYLPKEYGGENGSIPEIIDYWEEKILSYREFFKEDTNYGTDESLRPGKPIDFESIFGLDGSFRKLNVD